MGAYLSLFRKKIILRDPSSYASCISTNIQDGGQPNTSNQNISQNRYIKIRKLCNGLLYIVLESLSNTTIRNFVAISLFNIICLLFSSASDGVYYLKLNKNSEIYPVYCHMSSLSTKCGGGGWTLVMKLDRDKVEYVIANNIHSNLVLFPNSRGTYWINFNVIQKIYSTQPLTTYINIALNQKISSMVFLCAVNI